MQLADSVDMAFRHSLEPHIQPGAIARYFMFRARKFKELERRLGYRFRSEALLGQALTHASARGDARARVDNERLEFVGDRVLGLAIAEQLNTSYPNASEGELARRLNNLVNGAMCACVGRELGIGPHLILSGSESDSGGRDKDTILADALEAILGAVFLDGGFEKARGVVLRLWRVESDRQGHAVADAKSALQEWAQGTGLPLPEYKSVSRKGPDHAPLFTAEVRVKGKPPARGEGSSKRAAEQAAATEFLEREGVKGGPPHA
jgi:ribonuclease-3